MSIKKYKTSKGELRFAVNVYNRHLKRSEWVGTFKTEADAKLAYAEADRRIRLGITPVEHKDIAFSSLVDEWLALQTVNLRPSTRADYGYQARYIREHFGNVAVSSVTKPDVYRFVSWVSSKGLSDNYVRKVVVRLSQIFRFAESMGYSTQAPMATPVTNLPRQPERRIRPLSPADIRALIAATPPYWRPALTVMATCGLRRSETFGLVRSNADLAAGLLHVTHQLVGHELAPLKTRRARRVIPMPNTTVETLRQHMETAPPSELDLLFPSPTGRPVNVNNFRSRIWKPSVEAAGLRPDLTMHDLRRTYASALARQGRSAAFMQDVLGHEQAKTTLAYYIGVYDEERAVASTDMDDWLAREHALGQAAYSLVARPRRNT